MVYFQHNGSASECVPANQGQNENQEGNEENCKQDLKSASVKQEQNEVPQGNEENVQQDPECASVNQSQNEDIEGSEEDIQQDPQLTPEQLKQIVDYFEKVLQKEKLVSFVFRNEQQEDVVDANLMVQTVQIPPLANAMSEEEWNARIQKIEEEKKQEQLRVEQEIKKKQEDDARQQLQFEITMSQKQRQKILNSIPKNLDEIIEQCVAARVEEEKNLLQDQYQKKEQELINKIKQLEKV
eukprot:TRINITY_DN15030_c0_g1_i2.p2 TRINITY_DN15030_c0_g1~~TRINITY_DN15030_c0_g1_i2.p2  ORF type:complete len:240 (+),score=52.05 TRINITY_DN15030_c0_g1_i2:3-722(+)